MPVSVIFENWEAGANIDDIMDWFEGLDRNQITAVIEFAVRSLDETPSSETCRRRDTQIAASPIGEPPIQRRILEARDQKSLAGRRKS
jgi:hypothetical protein